VLTRRSFLLGGLGAAVVAGAGIELAGPERVLHRVGLVRSPDHQVPPSGWEVVEDALPNGTAWALAMPPDGDVTGIVLCLHGRGDDHRYAFDTIHLHDVVVDEGLRLGVASLDGGADSYWHRRADGRNPALDIDEVARRLRAVHHTSVSVLGWSMGGYGALLAGERDARFRSVVAASPAIFRGWRDATPGAFDDAEDFARNDVLARATELDPTRVRVDCGTHDPFEPAARRLVEHLGPKVTSSFTRGYHDAPYWRSVAPAQVRFLAKGFSLPLQ
jgi:pimeloyl-ACP methyl ester carboxylesterase